MFSYTVAFRQSCAVYILHTTHPPYMLKELLTTRTEQVVPSRFSTRQLKDGGECIMLD